MKPDLVKILREEEKRIKELENLIQERKTTLHLIGQGNAMYSHHKIKLDEYLLEYFERTGRNYDTKQ